MLIEIRLLGKCLGAAEFGAFEGPFFSMHTKMIEKIVPLAKEHSAVLVIASKDFDEALCLGILVFVYGKVLGLGYCLIDLK